MNSDDNYKKVSCDFYDQLEIHAMRSNKVLVNFELPGENPISKELTIKTLKTLDGKEYLISAKGEEIRLDRINSIEKLSS